MSLREAGVEAAARAADHRGGERVLLGEVDAVEQGLGDAHERGDGAGDGHLAGLCVAGAQAHDQARRRGAHVGDEATGAKDAVVAELAHLHDAQRGHTVVDAEHDHDGKQPAHEDSGGPCRVGGQEREHAGEPVAHDGADGAEDRERERAHDEEGKQGNKDQVNGLGDHAVEELLNIRLDKHHEEDGHDARAVARQRERNRAEEAHGVARGHERGPVGMQHHGGDGRGEDRAALELLGLGEGEHDRQEVEDAVREDVQHRVGLRGLVDEVEHDEKRHDGLDHAGARHGGDHGLEDGRDEVDDDLGGVGLLAVGGDVAVLRAAGLEVAEKGLDLGEDVGHVRADDDLVLAAAVDDLEDAVDGGHGIVGDDGLVLEVETQAGRAVRGLGHIALAADGLHDVAREFSVVGTHSCSFLLNPCPAPGSRLLVWILKEQVTWGNECELR